MGQGLVYTNFFLHKHRFETYATTGLVKPIIVVCLCRSAILPYHAFDGDASTLCSFKFEVPQS